MAIRIDEMTTSLEIRDTERLRRLVREEVERQLRERDRSAAGRRRDPADPTAGSGSGTGE